MVHINENWIFANEQFGCFANSKKNISLPNYSHSTQTQVSPFRLPPHFVSLIKSHKPHSFSNDDTVYIFKYVQEKKPTQTYHRRWWQLIVARAISIHPIPTYGVSAINSLIATLFFSSVPYKKNTYFPFSPTMHRHCLNTRSWLSRFSSSRIPLHSGRPPDRISCTTEPVWVSSALFPVSPLLFYFRSPLVSRCRRQFKNYRHIREWEMI